MIPDIRIFLTRHVCLEIMMMRSSIWHQHTHTHTHTHTHVIRPHLFATSYAVSLVYCMPFCEERVTDTRRDARQMHVFTRAHHKYLNVMVLWVPRCAPRHDGWLSAFLLKSKTYYMDHQFNIQTLCAADNAFMCFAWISEQTAIISLYSINLSVF